MRTFYFCIAPFLMIFLFAFVAAPRKQLFFKYSLGPESCLTIKGETNLNHFDCISNESISQRSMTLYADRSTSLIEFVDSKLSLDVLQIDCKRHEITKDLRRTLQVENFPEIDLILKNAISINCEPLQKCADWVQYDVRLEIIIAGTSHENNVHVRLIKTDEMNFRCQGILKLQFSDFDLEPPTALLGLVKVKNDLEIDFDLDVYTSQINN